MKHRKTVLWWGRFDPEYSRNRLLRRLLTKMNWQINDFRPKSSLLGGLEAALRRLPKPDLVWVPSFRQRDLFSARRWSAARKTPLLFDPLISAYDKQVFERRKFPENSRPARKLLIKESRQMQAADLLLADTGEHARFYHEVLGVSPERLFVVHVGAEEDLFQPENDNGEQSEIPDKIPEVLFYGSFIQLQGPQFIAAAIRLYQGPPVRWCFLGDGPLLSECRELTSGLANVFFENWLPYRQLPARIRRADILLGIFGDTPKTRRVIPNKVFQAMACGRPVITAATPAYPQQLLTAKDSGLTWVTPAYPEQLASAVALLAANPVARNRSGKAARRNFLAHFATSQIKLELACALNQLNR